MLIVRLFAISRPRPRGPPQGKPPTSGFVGVDHHPPTIWRDVNLVLARATAPGGGRGRQGDTMSDRGWVLRRLGLITARIEPTALAQTVHPSLSMTIEPTLPPRPCPECGGTHAKRIATLQDDWTATDIFECDRCGCTFRHSKPLQKDLTSVGG